MHVVIVNIQVKSEFVEDFIQATLDNGKNSIKESGVVRFDILQKKEDPCHFILYEVYRAPEDVDKHKTTGHYLSWRDVVEHMMAGPRQGITYANIFPDNPDW